MNNSTKNEASWSHNITVAKHHLNRVLNILEWLLLSYNYNFDFSPAVGWSWSSEGQWLWPHTTRLCQARQSDWEKKKLTIIIRQKKGFGFTSWIICTFILKLCPSTVSETNLFEGTVSLKIFLKKKKVLQIAAGSRIVTTFKCTKSDKRNSHTKKLTRCGWFPRLH